MSLKYRQIVTIALFCLAYIVAIPSLWLGISPELTFLDFFLQAKSLLPLVGILGFLGTVLAYLLGWNPSHAALKWLRSRIVYPLLTSGLGLFLTSSCAAALVVLCGWHWVQFDQKPHPIVVNDILAENFAGADQQIVSADLPATMIAELTFINDALRQRYFSSTQDPDPSLCRIYLDYLKKRNLFFRGAWWRFLHLESQAACLEVVGNPREAEQVLIQAHLVARWLARSEGHRSQLELAELYLDGLAGPQLIESKQERMQEVIALLSHNSSARGLRTRGKAYYLLENSPKAIEIWRRGLSAIRPGEIPEHKRLFNNLAFGSKALDQKRDALTLLEKGLAIKFDEENEEQRREQIRLLSTKFSVLRTLNRCDEAIAVWRQRESLKKQLPSPCSALLEVQARSCGGERERSPQEQALLHGALFRGIGLSSFGAETTKPALTSALSEAVKTFKGCYQGLHFERDLVAEALGIGPDSVEPPSSEPLSQRQTPVDDEHSPSR